jgi:hypothetical protein
MASMAALALALVAYDAGRASAQTQTTVIEKRTVTPSGRMVVTSETKRTFTVGDDTTRVYVAPESVDLSTLRDKQVTVYVDDAGRVTKVTRIETESLD